MTRYEVTTQRHETTHTTSLANTNHITSFIPLYSFSSFQFSQRRDSREFRSLHLASCSSPGFCILRFSDDEIRDLGWSKDKDGTALNVLLFTTYSWFRYVIVSSIGLQSPGYEPASAYLLEKRLLFVISDVRSPWKCRNIASTHLNLSSRLKYLIW